MSDPQLAEYYDDTHPAHDALGRAARRLSGQSALYLGGDVGVEKEVTDKATRFTVSAGGKTVKSHAGPLAATVHGYKLAGESTAHDSPGGATKLGGASIAARVRELDDGMRDAQNSIARQEARIASREKARARGGVPAGPSDEDDYLRQSIDEAKKAHAQHRAERQMLMTGKKEKPMQERRVGSTLGALLEAHGQ